MKNKGLKRFYIFIWAITFILSLTLLIENILFIHRETIAKKDNDIKGIIIQDEGVSESKSSSSIIDNTSQEEKALGSKLASSIYSDIPILNYATDQMNGGSHNIIIDSLARIFPINQYVADAAFVNKNSLVKNENKVIDVLGIIDNIRNDSRIPVGKVESIDNSNELQIDIIEGGVKELEGEENIKDVDSNVDAKEVIGSINGEYFTLEQLLDRQFLYRNFYIIDPSTTVSDSLFDAKVLLEKDFRIEKDSSKPQILIYHTHSQEKYADSRDGVEEDTVVGVGAKLAEVLSGYGYNVIHDKTKYDIMGDRNLAYNYSRDGIKKILEENPSIEVMIDIHRDAGKKRVTTMDGVETAKIMLFNGMSTDSKGQAIERLPNPNLQGNLAFSLQLQLKAREVYPGFMIKNYLKSLRYNLHFRERSILAEVGTVNNTVAEAKNSMYYLGALINEVLTNK